ncbi:MAG: hypothetical protein ABSF26_25755 [Thermoguttaceae bacterium]|jgi:hypothetical protein
MIPDFDELGNLPPGVHRATLEEVAVRFGRQSEVRRVQIESLAWLVALARKSGAARLIVNGSFVTEKLEPNDVDCLVLTSAEFPRDRSAAAEMLTGLPFMGIQVVAEEAFKIFVDEVFSSDRDENPKGMVEVIL